DTIYFCMDSSLCSSCEELRVLAHHHGSDELLLIRQARASNRYDRIFELGNGHKEAQSTQNNFVKLCLFVANRSLRSRLAAGPRGFRYRSVRRGSGESLRCVRPVAASAVPLRVNPAV